jgi:hypothetical protein
VGLPSTRRLSNRCHWDYKTASSAIRSLIVLLILPLLVLLAGVLFWAIKFIGHPTIRTLLRVFIGLCLAAFLVFICLVSGFPTSLLVSAS